MDHQNILWPKSADFSVISAKVNGLVFASYEFPANDIDATKKMAVQIASGQTLGYVPENLNYFQDYVGRVQSATYDGKRGSATIAFPGHLFGSDMAGLLTVLFGKISFAPGLRLAGIAGDQLYISQLPKPRLGFAGLQSLAGQSPDARPLLMAILKPGMGPDNTHLADQFSRLVHAGVNLVKDDETRIDCRVDEALQRLEMVLKAGRGKGIYVTHLTGPAFELKERALRLQRAGAQAFLFCPYTYGISVFQGLCQDPEIKVPVFAHPALTGIMGQGSSSMAARVTLGTLLRWCGADAVLFPSPYGTIALPHDEAVDVHRALISCEGSLLKVASVPSAGIMPEHVSKLYQDFGRDVIVNAGTGMARTGNSIEEGAQAFLAAIEREEKIWLANK